MGELANETLDGLRDMETGEIIDGRAPGHPRRAPKPKMKTPRHAECPTCHRKFAGPKGLVEHRKAKTH
jgi:hypothetical protein